MLYHVSLFPVKQFYPRIPVSRCCGENSYISRISFSQFSALKALSAIPEGGRNISCMLKLGICPVLYRRINVFWYITRKKKQKGYGIWKIFWNMYQIPI